MSKANKIVSDVAGQIDKEKPTRWRVLWITLGFLILVNGKKPRLQNKSVRAFIIGNPLSAAKIYTPNYAPAIVRLIQELPVYHSSVGGHLLAWQTIQGRGNIGIGINWGYRRLRGYGLWGKRVLASCICPIANGPLSLYCLSISVQTETGTIGFPIFHLIRIRGTSQVPNDTARQKHSHDC